MKHLLLTMALVLGAASAPASSLDDRLVGHLTFDEETMTGVEVLNAVPNAPDGVIKTAPKTFGSVKAIADGMIQGAAKFEPAAMIQFDDPAYANFPQESFTFSGWINADVAPNEEKWLRMLIMKGRHNQEIPGWAIALRFDVAHGDTEVIFGATDDSGTLRVLNPSIENFEAHRWYHIVVVMDRADAIATMYLDGQKLGTRSFAALENIGTSAPLVVGRILNGGAPFSGSLDDFALWSRALSSSEVEEVYARGRQGRGVSVK